MATRLRWLQQKIQQHPFVVIGIILLLIALIALIIAVVLSVSSNGTGFSEYTVKSTATETILSPQTKVTTTIQSQPGKTLWDWLQLLIIPVVLAVGGLWFNQIQKDREQRATEEQVEREKREVEQRAKTEREAVEKRAQTEREIAVDNQREAALQAYLDSMSELLLEKNLRDSAEDDEVRKIARVRTLTALRGLDAIRKASVFQFLHESGLIDENKRIIDLSGADLRGADLRGAILRGAVLRRADLRRAIFSEAFLSGVDLSLTDLREADLSLAYLSRASVNGVRLSGANLSHADLSRAKLSGAVLRGANLSWANLNGADLNGADLSEANLQDVACITTERLEEQAKSLQSTIMPDGSTHA